MDSNTILSNILQEEIQYFYNYIRDFDEKRIIDIAMVDDVYDKILEYDMCDVQKKAVMKSGTVLNNTNGTVILAPSRDKTTLVVLSKKVLPQKDPDEVRGTVIHELTHAHDFYDYADFCKLVIIMNFLIHNIITHFSYGQSFTLGETVTRGL